MAVIDDKVVAMSFESSKFQAGINDAIAALEKLKASLKIPAAGKGLEDVANAAKKVDLSHIGRSVDAIREKLGYFSVAALAIFANVAMRAVQTGAQIVKAFSLDPVIAGYREYATNLNSIQTILANTEASGTTLKDVNAALLELNKYSDQTIYNFSQMARNIGTFTAAGVELDVATGAIKGIANLAALSGSSADQASTAMYQLSQAISAGKVSLMDWNSVVNAGMGGTVFQRALAQTAEALGTLKKGTVELTGPMKNVTIAGKSFRNSLSMKGPKGDNWLTSEVLTTTLKQFTGDLKDAELAAMGFNAQQIKAIQQTAKTAKFAATEVKTITQVLDVAKETAGSGWAQTWQIIFGDFGEAKKTFTALSNAINGFINANAEARNKVLGDWKALGGRTELIKGITIAFRNLGLVLKPIKEAFRDIFPAATGRDLYNLTLQFKEFAKTIRPSPETMENLRRTFRGLFAVLDIGIQIVKGIFSVFGQLFHAVGGGSGGFLALTASIGDFFVSIDKALKKGNRLQNFFEDLGEVLSKPLEFLRQFAGVLADLFSGFSSEGISDKISNIGDDLSPLQAIVEGLTEAWNKLVESFRNTVDMQAAITNISEAVQGIAEAIAHAAVNMNFEAILAVIRTGLFAALVLMFKKFLGRGSFLEQVTQGFSSGVISNISGIFSGLNGSMKAMQQNIRAKTLKEIAIAIALLAASVLALSLVDPTRLNASLGAMTIMFGELIGAMALLEKVAKSGGFLKLPIIVFSLTGLAIAIDLLTISVFALSKLSWDELLRGLAGVGGLLLGIAAAVKPLSTGSAGLIRAGIGITALAVGLRILASAVQVFATMRWEEMGRGLAGVGGGLFIIAAATKMMPLGMPIIGAGLIIVATSLHILAGAVSKFGNIDWRTMGRGLVGVAGSLVIIAGAMRMMPLSMPVTAAGLILVALSLGKISNAIVKMGGMSIREIAKGVGTLAGSLTVLAVALRAMSGTFTGAAALTAAAVGVGLLAPALVLLGKQSWESIIKSLVALGGALTVLGIASLVLAPAVPALLGFGAAMLLIGGGMALTGAGLLAISAGISALAVAGPTGIGILVAALEELYKTIPELAKNVVLGLLEIANGIAEAAPEFLAAMVTIINTILDAIIKSSPKMAEAFIALLDAGLKVLRERQNEIIKAGINLLIALLKGIKDNIAQVTKMVVDIIVTFLKSLSDNIGRIVAAGVQLLVSFLKGIADNLKKVVTAAFDIVIAFINSITNNIGRVVAAGANFIIKMIEGISSKTGEIINAGTQAVIDFVKGTGKRINDVITAGVDVIISFIEGIGKNAIRLANAAGQVIVDFIKGLRIAIETYAPQIRTESLKLGWAIIDGMTAGMAGKAVDVYNKAKEIAGKALSYITKPWKILSPSRTMMDVGANIVQGLAIGLDRSASNVYSSAIALSNGVIAAFNKTFQTESPSKVMAQIGQYVGQGFAQGLRGTTRDINGVFLELNGLLTQAMASARETIVSEEKKLDELRAAKKPDYEAIDKAQRTIEQNEDLLARSIAGHAALTKELRDEKGELLSLVGDYERITERLGKAQEALKQAKQTRDDAMRGFKEQYSDLPDIPEKMTEEITAARENIAREQRELKELMASDAPTTEEISAAKAELDAAKTQLAQLIEGKKLDASGNSIDQLASYMLALKNQTAAVGAYASTLAQLRKLGLDDATYQKLLTEGTADQSFANQLLAGGKTAVAGLNRLDNQLMKVSERLATQSARNLYQAGVDSAQALVDGLSSRQHALHVAAVNMANEIINTLKDKMKMKSPSKIMLEIGTDAMEGLALGFRNSSNIVTKAVEDVAKNALTSMKNSVRKISDLVANELNPSPVITPILDLTQIRAQSGELAALTNVTPITAAASYGQASLISSEQTAAQSEELAITPGSTSVKFEQNNYSPTALTEIEIYRQTRNQLSQLKTALSTI